MRSEKKVILAILCCCLLLGIHPVWASVGETAAEVGKNAVSTSLGFVKTLGYSIKLIGEVIIFPFTLF